MAGDFFPFFWYVVQINRADRRQNEIRTRGMSSTVFSRSLKKKKKNVYKLSTTRFMIFGEVTVW